MTGWAEATPEEIIQNIRDWRDKIKADYVFGLEHPMHLDDTITHRMNIRDDAGLLRLHISQQYIFAGGFSWIVSGYA